MKGNAGKLLLQSFLGDPEGLGIGFKTMDFKVQTRLLGQVLKQAEEQLSVTDGGVEDAKQSVGRKTPGDFDNLPRNKICENSGACK